MPEPEQLLDRGLAELPARIRRLRQEHGWTLERLAGETGLSKPYLGRLEAGERQPSLAALLALGRAFGLSVSELLGQEETADEVVVRGDSSPEQRGNGLRYQPLSPRAGRAALERCGWSCRPAACGARGTSTPARSGCTSCPAACG
jgi:transcriptional regulator with XRE-family HTH domain